MSRTTRAKACWSSSLPIRLVEVGAGLLLDPVAPEVDDALAALRRRRGRSASRAPSAPRLPRSAHRPGRARRRDWPWRICPRAWSRYCRRRPSCARAPIASTRACSTASKTARACLPSGASLVWMRRSWQARFSAMESPRPRVTAMSVARRLLRQFGQPGAVAGQRRLVLGEADLELVVAGDGAHADRHGALETVGVSAVLRLAARVVAGTGHASCSVSPAPHWQRSPAVPRRRRAGRTRPRSGARARRTC